jgi:hypothetical protein
MMYDGAQKADIRSTTDKIPNHVTAAEIAIQIDS